MGAGKSAVGRTLAKRYGRPYVDLDNNIEATQGRIVTEIFQQDGEARFRQLEVEALEAALAQPQNTIIACGGGIVTNPASRKLLKSGAVVVYLHVKTEKALARIDSWKSRPLLHMAGNTDAIYALAQSRLALYETVADITVNTSKYDIDEVTDTVVEKLKAAGYADILA